MTPIEVFLQYRGQVNGFIDRQVERMQTGILPGPRGVQLEQRGLVRVSDQLASFMGLSDASKAYFFPHFQNEIVKRMATAFANAGLTEAARLQTVGNKMYEQAIKGAEASSIKQQPSTYSVPLAAYFSGIEQAVVQGLDLLLKPEEDLKQQGADNLEKSLEKLAEPIYDAELQLPKQFIDRSIRIFKLARGKK